MLHEVLIFFLFIQNFVGFFQFVCLFLYNVNLLVKHKYTLIRRYIF